MFMIFNCLAGICMLAFVFCSTAWHVPARRSGYTGQLVDEENRHIQLASLTILANEDWGAGAVPVRGINLLADIHYDTKKDGSGHVLSLLQAEETVKVEMQREGKIMVLRPGEERLLWNGDVIEFSEGELKKTYRYSRKELTPEEWGNAKWEF